MFMIFKHQLKRHHINPVYFVKSLLRYYKNKEKHEKDNTDETLN